jgi:hypothetical protein
MATQSQLEQSLEEQVLEVIEDWVPEAMEPGTIFVLEGQRIIGDSKNPYVAAMACPRRQCGLVGLITQRQLYGGERMICGSDSCSAEYHIKGEDIIFRKPQ